MPTLVYERISVAGTREEVNRMMKLEEMQQAVGGYIEMVPTTLPNKWLIVDEEGLLKDKPINKTATELVRAGVLMVGGIRGDALVVRR